MAEARKSTADLLREIDEAEAQAAASEPGAGEYLANRAKKGAAGFMGTPGDIVDVARDIPLPPHPLLTPLGVLMKAAAGKMGLTPDRETLPTESVIATSKTYRDAFGYDPNMKTSNAPLRYAGGVAEMAAAGGPMAVAMKPATLFPLATSTIGSGIGMELGGDIASGIGLDRQAGEMVGAVGGGIAGAAGSNTLQAGANMMKDRFSRGSQLARAEGEVKNQIVANIDDTAQRNLDRSLAVSDEFAAAGREFTPGLPARTGSPGLLAMEKQHVTQDPKYLNTAVRNIEKNEQEIREFVNTRFPQGQSVVPKIQKLQNMAMAKLEAMRTAVDDKLDEVARIFEKNPNNYEAGAKVRDLFFKQKAVYRGIRGQKYQEVYEAANTAGIRENIDDVVQWTDDVLKADLNAYQQSEIPSVFRTVRNKFMQAEAPQTGRSIPPDLMAEATKKKADVSFEELHSLYKRVNSDLASLRGSMAQDKDFKIMLLEKTKDMLNAKLVKYEGPEYGDVAAKLTEANRFHAQEYLPRFKQGFGGEIGAMRGTGEYRKANEDITGLITKANNAQAAKDFKLLFDDVPEAWDALRGGYMDQLWRQGGIINAEGRISQPALDRFLRQHSQTLSEFPQIRNELQQLALSNEGLLARRAQIVAAEKQLAASELYKLFQGKDPTVVMTEAFGNPNAMRLLAHHSRNSPATSNALARAIAEHVTQQPDPAAFLAKHADTIKSGLAPLGPDHWKNLNTAVEAATINARSELPTFVQSKAIAPDAIAAATGSSPRALIAHYINVARGRTGVNQEAAAFFGRWFDKLRADHKAVVMEGIFYGKDTAKAIADLARQPLTEKTRIEWAKQMASLGIRAEVAGQE